MTLLAHFEVVDGSLVDELSRYGQWLKDESTKWLPEVTTDKNEAKQWALMATGKTGVFYGGRITGPVAYKWKISWNENAKNVSMWNIYPETNRDSLVGRRILSISHSLYLI